MLSESSDSNDDDMSFDTTYEILYKECLNLKKEQVKWNGSKKSLINEIDVLKGENKCLLDKIAFLENEHSKIKKKCDELKCENQMFRNELSLMKEKSHPRSKRLNDLNNLEHKSFDKRGLGYVDEIFTPSCGKTIFIMPCGAKHLKKTHSYIKFHYTNCGKMGHAFMQDCLIMLKRN